MENTNWVSFHLDLFLEGHDLSANWSQQENFRMRSDGVDETKVHIIRDEIGLVDRPGI